MVYLKKQLLVCASTAKVFTMLLNETSSQIYRGDVAKHWDLIRDGLEQIRLDQKPDWSLDDIYSLCESERAHLFISDDGFVILQVKTRFGKKHLFGLVAYSRCGDGFNRYVKEFEDFGRKVGAEYIELWSNRKGWERIGWEKIYTCFRWRLS